MKLKKEYKELTGEDPPRADGGASKKKDKKKPVASGSGGSSGGASASKKEKKGQLVMCINCMNFFIVHGLIHVDSRYRKSGNFRYKKLFVF